MLSRFLRLCVAVLLCISTVAGAQDAGDFARQYTADLSHSHTRGNELRSEVSLNGVWQVSLQQRVLAEPPGDGWGYVLVPSSWMHLNDFPIHGVTDFDPGRWNGDARYQGKPPGAFPSAWYRRAFRVPAEWRGDRVVLVVGRTTVSGAIFVNGRPVGSQDEWEAPRWDITPHVKFGEDNELAVRVDAMLSGEVTQHLGAEQTRQIKISASLHGITQDVWLKRLPANVSIEDVFVKPSVRKGELAVQAELHNPAGATGRARLRAVVTGLDDRAVVKTFTSQPFELSGDPTTTVEFADVWRDPVLWELDRPHRYRLTVILERDGKAVDQTAPIAFGFREVWVEGRNLVLNGKPVHLRIFHSGSGAAFENLSSRNFARHAAPYLKAGYNSIQFASETVQRAGASAEFYDDALDFADANGLIAAMPIASVTRVNWNDPAERQRWEQAAATLIRRYRNHPSLALWSLNFNLLGYPWDLNPYAWADGYVPGDNILNLGDKRRRAAESETIVRGLDPTRVIYHHAGGNFGQIITSNFYPSFPPDQEREDYPEGWATRGAKPLITVEHGSPCSLDFLRGRVGNYETVRSTEMIEAEYAAMNLGAAAYALQEDAYLAIVSDNATDQKQFDADKYSVNQAYVWGYNMRLHEPIASYLVSVYPSYIRGWRTYGVTGFCPHDMEPHLVGRRYEPWHGPAEVHEYADLTAPGAKPRSTHRPAEYERLSPLGEQMARVHRPVLAYFGGDAAQGFSAKDHAYFSGQPMTKRIVLVNDLRQDLRASITWELVDAAGRPAGPRGQIELFAAAGTSAFAPIELTAPTVEARTPFELRLQIVGVPEDRLSTWPLAVQVWPSAPRVEVAGEIVLFDAAGQTKALLDQTGVAYRLADNSSSPDGARLIIIGRDALKHGLPASADIIKSVRQGATLLVFEQSTLQPFGLRTRNRGVRRVFPLIASHPVIEGLAAEDLADWRGEAGLLEPHPQPGGDDTYPEEPWRWGNRGVVASVMIEKPSAGAAWPILECEYDLGYTPLMETREGKGRILFCQLEVTQRYGRDPVATRIVQRLLGYARQPTGAEPSPVAVLGNQALRDYLAGLGIETLGEAPDAAAAAVWITDAAPPSALRERLLQAARRGATVVLLGPAAQGDLSWLGVEVKAQKRTFYRATPASTSPLMAGVSAADLFLKDKREDALPVDSAQVRALAEPAVIAGIPLGAGRVVLFPIDPRTYRDSKVTPERMGRNYRRLSRALALLIANCGGATRGLGDNFVRSAGGGDLALPGEWRFSIDPENAGGGAGWAAADFDDSAWRTIRVPGYWESQGVNDANPRFPQSKYPYDGYAWYRCRVVIPESYRGTDLSLCLGPIDDMDVTYLNGRKIGQTGAETPGAYEVPREYPIPADVIRFGRENVIAVKVYDGLHRGGILGPELKIRPARTDTYPYLDDKPAWNPYKLKRW